MHTNYKLQSACRKYGIEAFCFKMLELVALEDLIQREQHFISLLKPSYNIVREVGRTRLGQKSTPEHRAAMSKALKGRPGPMKGKKFSPEHRARISAALAGKKRAKPSPEANARRSASLKLYFAVKKAGLST